jgi:cell division protein FtsW (lipid II flippase)
MSVAELRPPRQRTGLALLFVALAIGIAAYAAVGFGLQGKAPVSIVPTSLEIVLAAGAAFAIQRWLAPRADPAILPVAFALAGIGLAMIYRISHQQAGAQLRWIGVGAAAFCLTLAIVRDDRDLDAFTYTIGLAALAMLLLPIVPGIGEEINGARLWIHFGPLTFQPSEMGKVLVVVFLASYLSDKRELLAQGVGRFGLPRVRDLGPLMLAWGASLAILFLEKDVGASLLYFAIFVVMLWVASGRIGYLIIGIALFAIGAFIGYLLFAHIQERVAYWLHALEPRHVYQFGYGQLAQGQFALASGGLVGAGLGRGSPTLIPYASTDLIFAAIGEELGMLGSVAVLMLLLTLVARGLRTAASRTDAFGKLLCTGLATILGLQTFVIVGGVTRLIPLTGITLPFVSYGGSSLLANFVILGLLARASARPRGG